MIYAFISKHKGIYSVEKMCAVLSVSKNAYYSYKRGVNKPSRCKRLSMAIKRIFYENRGRYGSRKIQKCLEKEGLYYSSSWVSYLMQKMGLKSIVRKRYVKHKEDVQGCSSVYPNSVNREFNVKQLGKIWVSDITYIETKAGWRYLTIVMDLADRQIVGYTISSTLRAKDTIIPAWNIARKHRKISSDFTFHSDRGVQFTSGAFTDILKYNRYVKISMSRRGNCWDNAVAESFFKSLKCELIRHCYFENDRELEYEISKYIQWYNTERIHQSLKYLTPKQMESILLTTFDNKP